MSEDTTTTEDVVEEQAAEEPQPEETINVAAESERSDVQPTQEATEEGPEAPEGVEDNSSDEAELLEWAKKKGLNTEDPASILKNYREAEKKLHDTSKEASELKKKIAEPTVDETETETLVNEMRLLNFYADNPKARELDEEMAETFLSYREEQPEFAAYLRKNLNVLYDITRAKVGDQQVQTARQQGRSDALKSTAKKQASSAPKANATTQSQPRGLTQERVNEIIASGKYAEHREEILAWEKENSVF